MALKNASISALPWLLITIPFNPNKLAPLYSPGSTFCLNAFKTGITMTLSSMVAVGVALIFTYSFSEVLKQIFTIVFIGLSFDLINTWITNASLLKWYIEKKDG